MKTLRSIRKFVFVFIFVSLSLTSTLAHHQENSGQDPLKYILGSRNSESWENDISMAEIAPGPSAEEDNGTLVLAANRTERPDILNGLKRYRGGWNITNYHYWASVGFTGATAFSLGVLWFIAFGLVLAVQYCCKWRVYDKARGLERARRVCLVLLVLFTCAASVGCIVLSVGQDRFHGEALSTLKYVVNQSDFTVQTLRNVTQYLNLAKTINVAEVVLPSNIMGEIDKLNVTLNDAAKTLEEKTDKNADEIKRLFHAVRSALISVAAVMLVLSLLGLLLSVLGHQHTIYIFVVSGWILVAMSFILCGVFVILNNAISDTCMAMEQWVDNPPAETALSSILPCVDQRTTNQTLMKSKEVITDVVNVVNTYVYTYANANPSTGEYHYYNQSGPFMPPLCYPFDSNLNNRVCGSQEVSMESASSIWKNYVCIMSESGLCITVGRVTPDIYSQLVTAVNESYALEHYTPTLLSLQDCNFVRNTFRNITTDYCPQLETHLKTINAGLGLISVGVMLCLLLWILYANRPRRVEEFAAFSSQTKNRSSLSHGSSINRESGEA